MYYDLTNRNWEFIEITSSGWRIVNNLILFHRYNNQMGQVYPSKEYHPDLLDKFVSLVLNLTNVDADKIEEVSNNLKILNCLCLPGFPKVIPMPNGTQGAAKSTLMELVRMCVGLNGINLAATKADILDRGIFFRLKRIADEDRKYLGKVQ